MAGESVVGLARWRAAPVALPEPLAPLPGPAIVAALAVNASPVGAHRQLTVAVPARLGARPGWCCALMVTDDEDARVGANLNWGVPADKGTLVWERVGAARRLRWVERDVTVVARPWGPPLPFLVPVRFLQRRTDGPVTVPGWSRGLGRAAVVRVEAPPGDEMTAVAGRHPGLVTFGLRHRLDPARAPLGWWATLRAPLRPGAALWFRGPDGRAVEIPPPRAA